MSALIVWQGLEERFATIPGIGEILLGEPRGAIDLPTIFGAYLSFEHPLRNSPPARNVIGFDHVFNVWLAMSWVDQNAAELQLLGLLDAIPLSIDADPHLGGRLTSGAAWCSDGLAGLKTIGGSRFRIVSYTVHVVEKIAAT